MKAAAPQLPWWTWLVPALVAHAGTRISFAAYVEPWISSVYLSIPFGLVMAWCWGPRVLPGIYVNAVATAGLWEPPAGHVPLLDGVPETATVAVGYWLLEYAGGRCWLPRLNDVVKFVLLALLPAALCNGLLVTTVLDHYGVVPPGRFGVSVWIGAVAVVLDGVAITAPLAMLVTPWLERRGWSRTRGAVATAATRVRPTNRVVLEIVAAFGAIVLVGHALPLESYWSGFGVFALWIALRHGVGPAVLANAWIVLLTMLVPAMIDRAGQLSLSAMQNLQVAVVLVCLMSLFVGRTISDQRDDLERRKEADRALAEREAFLRLSQRAGHVGSWQWDIGTNRFRWSDELLAMHGIGADEFDGSLATVEAFCHPGDRPRLQAVMQAVRTGGEVREFECRIVPRRGPEKQVVFAGQVQRDADGAPTGVLGVAIDITARKRAEQALTRSEERLRMIVHDQTEFLVKWLPDGTRTFVNDSYCRYFGVTQEECIGTSFIPLVAPEYREMLRAKIAALTPAAPAATTEHISLTREGERRWQQWTDRGMFDAAGNLVELLSTGRDITERRAAEEALREVVSRYRAILESSLDGLIVMNGAGEILEWNGAAEALFGRRRADVVGQQMAELIIPASRRETHVQGVQRYLATRIGRIIGKRIEMPALRGDGTEVRVELAVSVIAGTEPPLFAGVVRDISQRLGLEEQLRQSQKMDAVGQLAGGIAHDFNNLLTVIVCYADLLHQQMPAGDSRIEMVNQIQLAGERSAALTRQLLAFSRRQVMSLRVLDLNEIVRDVDRLLRRVIGEDVTLTLTLATDTGCVSGDPGQLEQVLLNLVVNARDAMPQGGLLAITTGNVDLDAAYAGARVDVVPGPFVLLSVRDSGHGMTPAIVARIFEPFFTTKESGRGTGLGLSVVHGIVKQCGGHIDVESEPGVGSCFKVYLPRVARPSGPVAPVVDHQPPRGTETILLVEDEAAVRSLTSRTLRQCGYTVIESGNADEALRAAADHATIHMLVTDVVVPGLSGRVIAERFSVLHPRGRVLYVSGYTNDSVIRHGILHQEVAFLQKPFSLRGIAQKVREVLDAK